MIVCKSLACCSIPSVVSNDAIEQKPSNIGLGYYNLVIRNIETRKRIEQVYISYAGMILLNWLSSSTALYFSLKKELHRT